MMFDAGIKDLGLTQDSGPVPVVDLVKTTGAFVVVRIKCVNQRIPLSSSRCIMKCLG